MGERQIDKETIEPEQVVADTYERNLVVNTNATTSYQQSSIMTTVSFTPMHLQLSVALLFSLCVSLFPVAPYSMLSSHFITSSCSFSMLPSFQFISSCSCLILSLFLLLS